MAWLVSRGGVFMIGLFPGTWDFLHPGHLKALQEARAECDYLIALLQTNAEIREGKNKPVFSVSERYQMLKACRYVDEIIPYTTEDELVTVLEYYSPCTRFLGSDWRGKKFTGWNLPRVEHKMIDRFHNLSSSDIRKRLGDQNPTVMIQ